MYAISYPGPLTCQDMQMLKTDELSPVTPGPAEFRPIPCRHFRYFFIGICFQTTPKKVGEDKKA